MASRRKSVQIAQSDWETVRKDVGNYGNRIFYNLFSRHPDVLAREFLNLRDIPRNQVMGSSPETMHPKAKAHALVVVNKLAEIVGLLGDDARVNDEMAELGRSHAMRPLTKQGLDTMKIVLVDTLQEVLGFGSANREAWLYETGQVVDRMWQAIEAARS